MDRKYNLKLDLQFRCNNQKMRFDIHDNLTSDFFIRVTSGGRLVDLEKAIVILAVIKPNQTAQSQFLEVTEGKVYADLNPNMKDQVGIYKAKALLIHEDERVTTDIFQYEVTEDNILNQLENDMQPTAEFAMLQQMLSRLSTIEITEEDRVINEANRILAEEERKKTESNRVEAENIRSHEEADRAKYEATRQSNETSRIKKEDVRVQSENARINNENARINNEITRVQAEQERSNNYKFMTEDEQRRKEEANSHKTAELARVQAEKDRVSEEAKRRTVEEVRVLAENARNSKENERTASEISRVQAENQRVLNENGRKENEINRTTSENARLLAEQQRVAEHKDREKFMESFESKLQQMEADYNEAVANMTNGNESATNSEIVLARKGKTSLREKIDEVDSQIKEKANNADLAIERKRIDSFTSLAEGSTTGDAEIIDARIGADEIIYDNLGSAIRTQFKNINNDFNEIIDIEKSINILDRDSDKNKIAGYIQADGTVKDYDELSCIDFLPIDTNHFYAISGFVNSYCAFYNENKVLVSSGKPGDFGEELNNFIVITPPSQSKFMRLTYTTGASSRLNVLELTSKDDVFNYRANGTYEYYVRKHINGINNIKENIVQIECEINTLKETNVGVDILKKGNLFDASKSIAGYIQADGTVRDYDTLWCSDYCEIEPGKLYRFGTVAFSYYAFYDENKNFIANWDDYPTSIFTPTIYTVDTPQNAKYFRCTFDRNPLEATESNRPWVSNLPEKPYEDDTFVIKNLYPNTLKPVNPCDYSELTVQVFNKCLCIGDSLTYGGFNMDDNAGTTGAIPNKDEQSLKYSYPSQFSKITGIQTTNKGVSGYSTIDWFNNYEEEDLSGHDMCIIFLGVNDAAKSVSDDDTKLYLGKIVDKVKNENKHIKIYLMTIIPAYNADDYLHKNEVIKEFANGRSDVILLDIAKYGHARQCTSYTSGHLSALGYYMLAKDLAKYISWHIDNNLRQYRDIQFIGTDGYYTKD